VSGIDEPAIEAETTRATIEAIVLGASAGAIEALNAILASLPAEYPLPLMIVVHLPREGGSALAELYRFKCRLRVKEAEDKEPIHAGIVYFAPPDYHLLVEPDRRLSLSNEEPVQFSRPSIDVLFESAADAYGQSLLGIVLTGANCDGACGLKAISGAGGYVVVQDPESAQSPMMPQAALAACPEARVLNLQELAAFLREVASAGSNL